MRKVIAFGACRKFVEDFAGFLKRHGFEVEAFNSRKKEPPGECSPVLIVFEGDHPPAGGKSLDALKGIDRRLPLVFVSSSGTPAAPVLRNVKRRARFVLEGGFTKSSLLSALKGCDELLELREKAGRLQSELDYKSSELSYLLETASALASTLELSKALSKIMERTRKKVNASSWAVMLMDEDDHELVLEAARNAPGSSQSKYRLKPGEGIAGRAASLKEAVVVNRVPRRSGPTAMLGRATGMKVKSVMAVPIIIKDRLLGVVEMVNKEGPDGFTQGDADLVSRLMDHTAIAIDRAEMYRRMADLVITDDLTKLFNMRYLDRTLEVEIERANRYGHPLSLIFIDIDFFKNVNDQYGHLVGSKLLVEISQILLKGIRRVDIVARYGGDEFVVVLPQTDMKTAKWIAERLRKNLEKHVFLRSEDLAVRLTASLGVAGYPEHADSKEELLRIADEALYAVKSRTRNSVYLMET